MEAAMNRFLLLAACASVLLGACHDFSRFYETVADASDDGAADGALDGGEDAGMEGGVDAGNPHFDCSGGLGAGAEIVLTVSGMLFPDGDVSVRGFDLDGVGTVCGYDDRPGQVDNGFEWLSQILRCFLRFLTWVTYSVI